MKNALKSCKAGVKLAGILVDVALAVALIPVIKTFITNSSGNFTATEFVLMSLIGLFLVIALVINILKQTGVMKK